MTWFFWKNRPKPAVNLQLCSININFVVLRFGCVTVFCFLHIWLCTVPASLGPFSVSNSWLNPPTAALFRVLLWRASVSSGRGNYIQTKTLTQRVFCWTNLLNNLKFISELVYVGFGFLWKSSTIVTKCAPKKAILFLILNTCWMCCARVKWSILTLQCVFPICCVLWFTPGLFLLG